MTLDELQANLPEQLRPWAATYGPAFLAMTADEAKAWIEMLIRGDVLPAYQAVLEKLPNGDLLAEWGKLNAQWQAANQRNAQRVDLQQAAATAALKVMLAVALAAVGL